MKKLFIFFLIAATACNNDNTSTTTQTDSSGTKVVTPPDTSGTIDDNPVTVDPVVDDKEKVPDTVQVKTYSNKRFRDVRVQKLGNNRYRIRGKAQIFEANFGWVVEDGHNEIKGGNQMTDAGAPEWGNFDFTIQVEKQRPNSTLMLVLYESSAKDGSRQYELPIKLG